MIFFQRLLVSLLTLCCTAGQIAAAIPFVLQQNTKEHFLITVQNSGKQPQTGMFLRVSGQSEKVSNNVNGLFDFEAEIPENGAVGVYFYFADEPNKTARYLTLNKAFPRDTVIVIDGEKDIILFKQQNTLFPIQGVVKNHAGKPISKATVTIQGTGRKATTDEKGLFQIDADYNHTIVIRAEGMKNESRNIQQFLPNKGTPQTIRMQPLNTHQVYNTAHKMPEYPQGMKGFRQYLKKNLRFQTGMKQGVVVVQFVVETDGSISSPTIARGLTPQQDTLAIDLINQMPDWIPAEKADGTKIRCRYSLPISFKPNPPKPQKPTKTTSAADSTNVQTKAEPKADGQPALVPDSIAPIPADSLTSAGRKANKRIAPRGLAESDSLSQQTDTLSARLPALPNDEPKAVQPLMRDSLPSAVLPKPAKREEETDSVANDRLASGEKQLAQ